MKRDVIRPTLLERTVELGRGKDTDGDYVVKVAFASDLPYERWWGIEVLECTPEAVRLDRLNDGAPILYNHDKDELRGTHVKGSAKCDDDGVLRGEIRLSSVTQDCRDTLALVKSGILTKASVGYLIHKVVEKSKKKDGTPQEITHEGRMFSGVLERSFQEAPGDRAAFLRSLDQARGAEADRGTDEPPTFLVMDWEPYENSLVTIPADNSVGVGRTAERAVPTTHVQQAESAARSSTMTEEEKRAAEKAAQEKAAAEAAQRSAITSGGDDTAVAHEAQRQKAISNLCRANKIDPRTEEHWIRSGKPLDQVSEELVKVMEERGKDVNTDSPAFLGMERGEVERYSISRAIHAIANKNWGKAGLELKAHEAIAKRLGRAVEENSILVPLEVQDRLSAQVLARQAQARGQRDFNTSTGGGAYLIETQNVGFMELLRNRSVFLNMGAMRIPSLTGSVTIPRQSAAGTAYWLANETSQLTESNPTLVQMTLTPKTVGAYTEISRQLLLQSAPGADIIVMNDIARVVALGIDAAGFTGTGSNGQPQGLTGGRGISGVGSVTGTSLGVAGVIEFQADVAGANALSPSCGYVTTPTVAGLLMQRARFSNTDTPLWEGNMLDGKVFGFRAMSSNQVPSATVLFGDFGTVVIAEWGVLQIDVNPQADFKAGIIGVRGLASVDIGFRLPAGFSLASSVT
mgnify:CR=1 FL=1